MKGKTESFAIRKAIWTEFFALIFFVNVLQGSSAFKRKIDKHRLE